MKNLSGYIICLMSLILGASVEHIVFPKGKINGRKAMEYCRTHFGRLIHRQDISGAIKRGIIEQYTGVYGWIHFWVAGCNAQAPTKGLCYRTSLSKRGKFGGCEYYDCDSNYKYNAVCWKTAKDRKNRTWPPKVTRNKSTSAPRTLTSTGKTTIKPNFATSSSLQKTAYSSQTFRVTQSSTTASVSGVSLDNINLKGNGEPDSTPRSGSVTPLERGIFLKNIVIPGFSVILVVLIVIVIWLLIREKQRKNNRSGTAPEYANTAQQQNMNMDRPLSNATYAVPDDEHIVPPCSAEYAEVNDGASRGQKGGASYSNANTGEDSKPYSYATFPLKQTSVGVDRTMTYANITDAGNSAGFSNLRANHSRSLAVIDNFYNNTLLR